MSKVKQLAIIGPTAAGKSDLALEVSKKRSIEIIAVDSRTIYQGLDIGTAKPSRLDQAKVAHHLLDVVKPGQTQHFNVFSFLKLAKKVLKEIEARGNTPVLVGGSGLYLSSILYNYQFPAGRPNEKERERFRQLSLTELRQLVLDRGFLLPKDSSNRRRLERCLELAGQPVKMAGLSKGTLIIGLNPPRDELWSKIATRYEKMIQAGVVAEARWALENYPPDSEALKSNIYRPLTAYLKGEISFDEVGQEFIKRDRALAKKQLTWFNRYQEAVWFAEPSVALEYILKRI